MVKVFCAPPPPTSASASECWEFYAIPTDKAIFTAKKSLDVFSLKSRTSYIFLAPMLKPPKSYETPGPSAWLKLAPPPYFFVGVNFTYPHYNVIAPTPTPTIDEQSLIEQNVKGYLITRDPILYTSCQG